MSLTTTASRWALLLVLLIASMACSRQSTHTRQGAVFSQQPSAAPSVKRAARGKISPARLARRIHQLINAERRKRRLRQLRWDGRLAILGRTHSRDMVRHRFFSHTNHRGESSTQRGRRQGIRCRHRLPNGMRRVGLAENIHQNNLYDSVAITIDHQGVTRKKYNWNSLEQIARTTVQGWMDSPGHRRNILDPVLLSEGIGIAINRRGQVLVTQVFC